MPILLPLTLLGLGYLVYQLFAGATLALPIALGFAAGLDASHLGFAPLTAFILGLIAFVAVISVSRLTALKINNLYGRISLALLFAVPAALAGFSVAHALGVMVGTTGIVTGFAAAVACGAIAGQRILRPAV